jgi:hypothetical protein
VVYTLHHRLINLQRKPNSNDFDTPTTQAMQTDEVDGLTRTRRQIGTCVSAVTTNYVWSRQLEDSAVKRSLKFLPSLLSKVPNRDREGLLGKRCFGGGHGDSFDSSWVFMCAGQKLDVVMDRPRAGREGSAFPGSALTTTFTGSAFTAAFTGSSAGSSTKGFLTS